MALANDCSYLRVNFLLGLQRDANVTLLSLFPVSSLLPVCQDVNTLLHAPISMMLCLIISQKHRLQL